ncbi:hypothetical protein THAOC_01020, partial [Thalassiosira oceanica]
MSVMAIGGGGGNNLETTFTTPDARPMMRHYFMKMRARTSIAVLLICSAVDSVDADRLRGRRARRDLLSSNDIDVKPIRPSQFFFEEATEIKWYPDVLSEAGRCKHDTSYPDWMAYEKNSPNFLFESEKDCCERYDCLITADRYEDAFDTEARDDVRFDDEVALDGIYLNEDTLIMSMSLTAKPTVVPSSSPSLAPTSGSPTSSPSRSSFWYPDVFSQQSSGCLYGSNYGPWMIGGGFSFIYESEEECCSKFPCEGYVPPSMSSRDETDVAPPLAPCTREYMPVCGVNGRVYGNTCLAKEAAGVEVACKIDMEKAPADMVYGDPCSCEKETAVSNADGDDMMIACPMNFEPVCGSDYKVYSNSCMAVAAGVESECELDMDDEPLSGEDCKCRAVVVDNPILNADYCTFWLDYDCYPEVGGVGGKPLAA